MRPHSTRPHIQHLALDEVAQALGIIHVACFYIHRAGQAYGQVIVVAVVVRIIALAKNTLVLLGIPGRIVQAVGGVEVLVAADSDLHRGLQPRAWLLCCTAVSTGKSRQNASIKFVEFNNVLI